MRLRNLMCWFVLLLLPAIAFSKFNTISALRAYHHKQDCRLVFDGNRPFDYQTFMITGPDRLVIDINKAHFAHLVDDRLLKGTPVIDIRTGSHKKNKLRIVLDLKHKVKVHSFTLKPVSKRPHYRLVLDLHWSKDAKNHPLYMTHYRAKAVSAKKSMPIRPEKPSRSPEVVIVIDPGHGGHDPGAIGRRGVHEKNIVLKISRYLQKDINRLPGFEAYLTRSSDHYLPLRRRLAIARKYHADMFVAIHADAFKNRSAQGASVYALSQRGATSEAAHWLARQENQSELMGGVDLTDKNHLLKSVLLNLSQTATIRASLGIGQRIINALENVGRLHHRRVEQAAFVVLKSPDIPSLLVETGFISNPKEERKLSSSRYQKRIARSVAHGIRTYFLHSPPRGTWLSARKFKQHAQK